MAVLAEQTIIRSIRNLARSMMGLAPAVRHDAEVLFQTPRDTASEVGILYAQVSYVGDLLLDTLRLEQEFEALDLTDEHKEEIELLRQCRHSIDQLTQDYVSLVARWRETSVRAACVGASRVQPIDSHGRRPKARVLRSMAGRGGSA